MKINEELYVSELAEILDIRTQSIYERLKKENNIINKYRVPDTDPVKLYKAVEKRKEFSGILIANDSDYILIEEDGKELKFLKKDISLVRLTVHF